MIVLTIIIIRPLLSKMTTWRIIKRPMQKELTKGEIKLEVGAIANKEGGKVAYI